LGRFLVEHFDDSLKTDLLVGVVFDKLVELRLEDDNVNLEVSVLGNLNALLDQGVDPAPLVVGHQSFVSYA